MKTKTLFMSSLGCLAIAALAAQPVLAQNLPPPSGNQIYTLTGQAISSSYQTATINFTANQANTNLAFAFREDPAFLELSDVSLALSGTSTNLLSNGDFSLGPIGSSAPSGWQYLNTFGAPFGGVVGSGCGPTGGNCYYDGAVGAYDGINQVVSTTIGETYTLTFQYADTMGGGTYQPLCTNGSSGTSCDGRDMFVYAGAAAPTGSVPEPGSLALLAGGLLGLAWIAWRRKRRVQPLE